MGRVEACASLAMLLEVCEGGNVLDGVWERGKFSILERTLSIDASGRVTVSFVGRSLPGLKQAECLPRKSPLCAG